MKSLIDPFQLLGINEKSTIKDARKAYYNLALLCHPDAGGNEENMKVLVNAYSFVEEQLKSRNNVTGDWEDKGKNLEKEFKEYNDKVKTEIPEMRDLFDMANEEQLKEAKRRNFGVYNEQFNKEFMAVEDPFSKGYGDLMDDDHDYKSDEEYIMPTKNKFTQEVQVYKEPHILPDTYGNNYRYDIKEVKDFSNYKEKEYDYVIAHSEEKNPPTEIESEMDKPISSLEDALKSLEQEREKLEVYETKIEIKLDDNDKIDEMLIEDNDKK